MNNSRKKTIRKLTTENKNNPFNKQSVKEEPTKDWKILS